MAKKPQKGNLDHGYLGRHGLDSASDPPDSMWTNPVARITPAAKALAATKRLPSVLRKLRFFPTRGMAIPITPEMRIAAIAMYLRTSAAESSRQASSNSALWQLVLAIEREMVCKKESFFVANKQTRKKSIRVYIQ